MITLLAAASAIALPSAANAAIVINIAQVGANVVVTGSGSFNTTGLSSMGALNYSVVVNGGRGAVLVGTQTDTVRYDAGLSVGPAFGANLFSFADSSSGNTFSIYGVDAAIHLPVAYVSGSMLSGSATYNNQTLTSMGLINGIYQYSSANDRVTVNVGPGAVAKPASWAMMILGMGAVGGVLRRRQKTTTRVAFAV